MSNGSVAPLCRTIFHAFISVGRQHLNNQQNEFCSVDLKLRNDDDITAANNALIWKIGNII